MSEHDGARQMLDEYRRSLQPTKGDQARVQQAILAVESRRAWWKGLVWRCSALAAVSAALIVLALAWMRSQGVLGDAGVRPSEAPRSIDPPVPDAAHERGATSLASPSRAVIEPATAPVVEPVPPASIAPAPVRPRAPSSSASEAPEGAADAVRAEATLVDRARRALDDEEFATVLALAGEHTRRFPQGTLTVEVAALRALALCGAGRRTQGRGEAQVFLREHPQAPYRDHLRRACGISTADASP